MNSHVFEVLRREKEEELPLCIVAGKMLIRTLVHGEELVHVYALQ